MDKIIFFHRNLRSGYSINKVSQTIIKQFSNKIEFFLPYYRATPLSICRNLWFIYKHKDKKCINHITGGVHYGILALWDCKSVLTIHDTNMYDDESTSVWKKFFFYLFWLKLPLKIATKVICISSETKRSIERFTDRKDIVIIYNAIDQMFENRIATKENTSSEKRILIIGTSHNKNIFRTIKALKGIECVVTIIGLLTEEHNRCLIDNNIKYINKSGLTDEEIYQEYCNCDIVSFCSTYEGFGMPIIEANSVGRPVICSDIEPLKEVASGAALLVNPNCIEDMRNSFLRLLNDSNLRDDLVLKGGENIKRFSSKLIYFHYRKLYESMF